MALYVQPIPPRYNVLQYKIWVICNKTGLAISEIVSANENNEHIRFNFSVPDGVYYIKVAALHPDCGKHGCANSTSPYIYISKYTIFHSESLWPLYFFYLFLYAFFIFNR